MQVNRGLFEAAVAKQYLNGAQVCSGLEQMSGEAVPQGMRMQWFPDIGALGGLAAGVPDDLVVDWKVGRVPLAPGK